MPKNSKKPDQVGNGVQFYAISEQVLQATIATLMNELPMVKVRGLVEALEKAQQVTLKAEKLHA